MLNYAAWHYGWGVPHPLPWAPSHTYDNGRQRLIRRGWRVKASEKRMKSLSTCAAYPTQLQRNKRNRRNMRNRNTQTDKQRRQTDRQRRPYMCVPLRVVNVALLPWQLVEVAALHHYCNKQVTGLLFQLNNRQIGEVLDSKKWVLNYTHRLAL